MMRKPDWLIPIGLMLLGMVPFVAGVLRIVELGGSAEISPENARFLENPLPVGIHIAGSLLFGILGALQFSPGLRRSRPHWHRISGRVVVLGGFASALTGLWMTLYFPNADINFDGPVVFVLRLTVGVSMLWSLVLAISAIRNLDLAAHQRWMTRAYALGLGAGTQAFTHIPWFVWPELQGEFLRSLCMASGWMLNIMFAEWILAGAGGKLGVSTKYQSNRPNRGPQLPPVAKGAR